MNVLTRVPVEAVVSSLAPASDAGDNLHQSKGGLVLGRFSIVLTLVAVAGLLLAACAVQQEPPGEEAAEEAGVEEPKSSKAQQDQEAKGPQVFEDLAVGDSAEFQNGLSVTVTASHIPADESVGAQKGREKEERARTLRGT